MLTPLARAMLTLVSLTLSLAGCAADVGLAGDPSATTAGKGDVGTDQDERLRFEPVIRRLVEGTSLRVEDVLMDGEQSGQVSGTTRVEAAFPLRLKMKEAGMEAGTMEDGTTAYRFPVGEGPLQVKIQASDESAPVAFHVIRVHDGKLQRVAEMGTGQFCGARSPAVEANPLRSVHADVLTELKTHTREDKNDLVNFWTVSWASQPDLELCGMDDRVEFPETVDYAILPVPVVGKFRQHDDDQRDDELAADYTLTFERLDAENPGLQEPIERDDGALWCSCGECVSRVNQCMVNLGGVPGCRCPAGPQFGPAWSDPAAGE